MKLYSDEDCTIEIGTEATSTTTVYAKALEAVTAIVTVTLHADQTKKAYSKEIFYYPTYNLTAKAGDTGELGTEYWATFYSNFTDYQASEGTQVFAVKLNRKTITMTEITDGIVNKGEGVVLKSLSPSITMTPSASASEGNYTSNSLEGTMTEITTTGENNYYVLSYKAETGAGFYKLSNTSGTIGANKAFLTYTAGAREFFLFDEATGIEAIDNGQLTIDNVVYDLQGRRVAQPAKGLYIVNGKKVIIK